MRLLPLLLLIALATPLPVQSQRPAASGDGTIRVLLYHDMEGLSGQDDWRTFNHRHPEHYRRGRELLVADVNAVIDGLFAGGADEVHVVDGHGSGNPEPDIPEGALDPRATRVLRDEPFDAYTGLVEPGVYDAIAVVGMHAKTGSGGFASHTYTLGIDLWLEGRSITETELVGYSWGLVDVPVIFASGDDRLREDLRTMPWIEYVTVKEALSADSVRLRPVSEARAELREGARRAVEDLSRMRPMRLGSGPLEGAVRAVPPASLTALGGVPGIDYEDGMVRFTAPDFQAVYDAWRALIQVARSGYTETRFDPVREHADGRRLLDAGMDRVMGVWFDYESGRWSPPAAATEDGARRYHGYH